MSPRAHRIEVDRCADCPFALHVRKSDEHQGCFCDHPLTMAYEMEHDVCETKPPTWCPLRGSVTMIAGPRP